MSRKDNLEIRNSIFLDRIDGRLIDKTTGELFDLNNEFDRERAKELIESELDLNQRERDILNQLRRELKEQTIVTRPNRKGDKHMRVFSDNGKALGYQMNYIDLSNNAMGLLLRMIYSLEYPTNKVISISGDAATTKELAVMSKQSIRTVQRSIRELEEKNIVYKTGETSSMEIYINPEVVSGGNISKETLDMFQSK